MCVDQTVLRPPHPRNSICTGNSLISSLDLDSPQKINLEWYLFLIGSLQITLLQIYFWDYKTIWDHFKHGGLLLQTTANQSECRTTKMLPPSGQPLSKSECRNQVMTWKQEEEDGHFCCRSATQCWKAFLVFSLASLTIIFKALCTYVPTYYMSQFYLCIYSLCQYIHA